MCIKNKLRKVSSPALAGVFRVGPTMGGVSLGVALAVCGVEGLGVGGGEGGGRVCRIEINSEGSG